MAQTFADHIEANQQALIDRLAESCAIKSVSGDPAFRPYVHRRRSFDDQAEGYGRRDVFAMGQWLYNLMTALGVE